MQQTFELQFQNKTIGNLNGLAPKTVKGWLSAWKGKLFEVIVSDKLNAGEKVGDIKLGAGQLDKLAESPTQPGWDLRIFNSDGTVAGELQFKATDSLGYASKALSRYLDISVIATDESADQIQDDLIRGSGISNIGLETTVAIPIEDLLDSPLEEFAETILPGTPLIIMTTMAGRKILIGRHT